MATQLSGEAAHLAAVLESEIASAKYLDAEPKLFVTPPLPPLSCWIQLHRC
jgi:hypothetical protein